MGSVSQGNANSDQIKQLSPLKQVNTPQTQALLTHCLTIKAFKRQLKESLVVLMVHINLLTSSGQVANTSRIGLETMQHYDRVCQRLTVLLNLGYVSRERVYTKHTPEYSNLRFGYWSYKLTDEGVRYLYNIFCKDEED